MLTHRWWLRSAFSVTQQPYLLRSEKLDTPPAKPSAGLPLVSDEGLFQKSSLPWSATISWLSATATPAPVEMPLASWVLPPCEGPNNCRVGKLPGRPVANITTSFCSSPACTVTYLLPA